MITLLRSCALGALAIGYVVLSHYTLTTPGHATLGAFVALTPIALASISLAWNTRYRFVVLALILVLALALAIMGSGMTAGIGSSLDSSMGSSINRHDIIGLHYSHLYWIEHAGTQMLLCVMFARTLRHGREALCTRFARIVHRSLTPALTRYTRQVTFAWALFFAVMASLSTFIFFAAPLRVWSIFANFLSAPLTCSMFVAEYAVRQTKNLDTEQVPILAAVKAFWKPPPSP